MNSKEKYVGIFWGVVLIVSGAAALVSGINSFTIHDPWLGMALTGSLSLAFFVSYYLSGVRKWGWLFPACIFAGTTLVILLSELTPYSQGGWLAAPVLLSVAVPFLVAYFLDREKNQWALIPTYVLTAVTLTASLADAVKGEFVGTLVLLLIALPFLFVYLRNRTQQWPLIPFGILLAISIIPSLSAGLQDEFLAAAILLLFSAVFLVVFFTNLQRWWALIPGGVLASIGITVLVIGLFPDASNMSGGLILIGMGATFLLVWLCRASAPTNWAIYPAASLGALGLIALITGQQGWEKIWPVFLILGGGWYLFRALRSRAQTQ